MKGMGMGIRFIFLPLSLSLSPFCIPLSLSVLYHFRIALPNSVPWFWDSSLFHALSPTSSLMTLLEADTHKKPAPKLSQELTGLLTASLAFEEQVMHDGKADGKPLRAQTRYQDIHVWASYQIASTSQTNSNNLSVN